MGLLIHLYCCHLSVCILYQIGKSLARLPTNVAFEILGTQFDLSENNSEPTARTKPQIGVLFNRKGTLSLHNIASSRFIRHFVITWKNLKGQRSTPKGIKPIWSSIINCHPHIKNLVRNSKKTTQTKWTDFLLFKKYHGDDDAQHTTGV